MFIPHIGRKKFSVNQTLHGRNMLIAEYLWLAYLDSLPPDEKAYYENLPKGAEPDHPMRRGRKQVSSHIQVLKNIFKYHKCCKWLARKVFAFSVAFLPSSPTWLSLG